MDVPCKIKGACSNYFLNHYRIILLNRFEEAPCFFIGGILIPIVFTKELTVHPNMPGIKAVKPDYPGLFPKTIRRRMQKARTAIITYTLL